jgi:hypothetical protein
MNSEELTLLMDTLRELGDGGKAAFIWWLVFDKLLPVIGWVTSLAIIALVIVRPLITLHSSDAYLRSLRDRLRIGTVGYLSPRELRELQQRIDELMEPRECN